MKGILERREQPVNMRTQENNRLDIFTDKFIAKSLTDHIKHIDNEIQILDKSIKKLNETNWSPLIAHISLLTVIILVVYLPELETHDDKKLSALVGITPMKKDSDPHRVRRNSANNYLSSVEYKQASNFY